MDRSIIAWPFNNERWYIQRRRTDRTYQASLHRECPPDMTSTMRFYDQDICEFITSECADLGVGNDDPWWRFPLEDAKRMFTHNGKCSGSAAIHEWDYVTDCDFGADLAKALGQKAYMLTTDNGLASPWLRTGRPIACITATVRPDVLSAMYAIRVRQILPVFEFRSQLLIGPVLRAGSCPCPVCMVTRLAAHDVSREAFISRCHAAGVAPHLFAARDITSGLPTSVTAPVLETVAAAMHKVANSQTGRMLRFNLVTREASMPVFCPLPGPSNDHWIHPSLQRRIGMEYTS
jgi:hypothetical protein